ncbi:hypothetical protein GW17_00010073 [Ensete ventricosum]|nr:hypothetical protein GW17_00010073 [Ensete ventricosum]
MSLPPLLLVHLGVIASSSSLLLLSSPPPLSLLIGIKKRCGSVAFFAECRKPLLLLSSLTPLSPRLQLLLSWIGIVEGGWHRIRIKKGHRRVRAEDHSPSLDFPSSSPDSSYSSFDASPSASHSKAAARMIPPGSGRSACKSADASVRTARYGRYHSVLQTLIFTNI